jgi:hypothetical protein
MHCTSANLFGITIYNIMSYDLNIKFLSKYCKKYAIALCSTTGAIASLLLKSAVVKLCALSGSLLLALCALPKKKSAHSLTVFFFHMRHLILWCILSHTWFSSIFIPRQPCHSEHAPFSGQSLPLGLMELSLLPRLRRDPTSCRSSHLPLASWVLELTLLRHWLPRSLERCSIWPRSANLQFLWVTNLVCVAVCFQGFLSLPSESFSSISMTFSRAVMVCGPLATAAQ